MAHSHVNEVLFFSTAITAKRRESNWVVKDGDDTGAKGGSRSKT